MDPDDFNDQSLGLARLCAKVLVKGRPSDEAFEDEIFVTRA